MLQKKIKRNKTLRNLYIPFGAYVIFSTIRHFILQSPNNEDFYLGAIVRIALSTFGISECYRLQKEIMRDKKKLSDIEKEEEKQLTLTR